MPICVDRGRAPRGRRRLREAVVQHAARPVARVAGLSQRMALRFFRHSCAATSSRIDGASGPRVSRWAYEP